jgi:hypothetical protein
MKTPASNRACMRLGWVACAALTLAACTGPGLEPPESDSKAGNAMTPTGGKQSDAGAGVHRPPDMATGSGGSANIPGAGTGTGGSTGSNSGGSGGATPPTMSQDAGAPVLDAGDEDAGQAP